MSDYLNKGQGYELTDLQAGHYYLTVRAMSLGIFT